MGMKFASLGPSWGRIVRGILVGSAVSAALIVVYGFSLLEPFELKTLDWRFRILSSPEEVSRDIAIVVVDQNSLDYYEELESVPWPWPRGLYQAVVDFANRGGARALIFDILFTERSGYGYEDDDYFAEVVKDAGNVYMPIFMTSRERPKESAEGAVLERALVVEDESRIEWESYTSLVLPLEEFTRSAKGLGNVMMAPDADGVYRRVPLLAKYEGKFLPSLPLAAVVDLLGAERVSVDEENRMHLVDVSIPLEKDGTMLVKYYGGAGTYEYYSIASIIQSFARIEEGLPPIVDPGEFRNRIVLVGLTAPGLFDLKPTPFSSVYPGVEVHATVIDNILRHDFLTRIRAGALFLFVFTVTIFCGAAVSHFITLKISIPIVLACVVVPFLVAFIAFTHGVWVDLVALEAGILLTFGFASVVSYSTEGRQRRFIKNAFKYYLSPPVIDELLRSPERLKLGGERKELTVFFSDVAGFTSLSEKLAPEELSLMLSRYLTRMTDIILAHQGTLDKYEGDAIMAFWGAPLAQPDHARRACLAALECQAALRSLKDEFRECGWPPLDARIGINSGDMVVGNMGSRERFDYTVLGDEVNLGSRLEGANKEYGTHIMISERTYHLVKDGLETRELDMLRVKGKQTPVRVYEVLAKRGELTEETTRAMQLFAEGLSLYRERRWREAIEVFKKLPQDPASAVFLRRCAELLQSPPQEWDGVYVMRTK